VDGQQVSDVGAVLHVRGESDLAPRALSDDQPHLRAARTNLWGRDIGPGSHHDGRRSNVQAHTVGTGTWDTRRRATVRRAGPVSAGADSHAEPVAVGFGH
jgi:hypothetical protein